jgi:hypothetical protein
VIKHAYLHYLGVECSVVELLRVLGLGHYILVRGLVFLIGILLVCRFWAVNPESSIDDRV